MLFNNNKQKSPQRRFLFILGVTVFISVTTFGLMVIFWDRMLPDMPKNQKAIFGVIIIVYAIIRFARLFKKEQDEDEE